MGHTLFLHLKNIIIANNRREGILKTRAVDPHSFYADPDPAVFLNADPDPDPVSDPDPGPGPT